MPLLVVCCKILPARNLLRDKVDGHFCIDYGTLKKRRRRDCTDWASSTPPGSACIVWRLTTETTARRMAVWCVPSENCVTKTNMSNVGWRKREKHPTLRVWLHFGRNSKMTTLSQFPWPPNDCLKLCELTLHPRSSHGTCLKAAAARHSDVGRLLL